MSGSTQKTSPDPARSSKFISRLAVLICIGVAAVAFWIVSRRNVGLSGIEVLVRGTDTSAVAAPALPAISGGPLAYTTEQGIGLFLLYPNGDTFLAGSEKLAERYFVWSPDGKIVAYRVERDPDMIPRAFALCVANVERRETEQITDYLPGMGRPGWRSLGTEMELYAPTTQGLVRRRFPLANPLPVSGALVYERDGDIWLEDGDRSPHQISRGGGYAPQLSPDGNRILYQWGDGIYLALTSDPPAIERRPFGSGISPVWSPDGSHIAFVRAFDRGHEDSMEADIWIYDLEAGAARQVTFTPREIEMELSWPEESVLYFSLRNDGSIRRAEVN